MSISAISGSSSYSSYSYDNTAKKKSTGGSAEDAMSQAISQIQTSDPQLASKLTDMQKQVDSMKKSGASEKDIQSTVKSTMDSLSDSEKTTLQSAMPKMSGAGRPSGPPPLGPPPSGAASGSSSSTSDSDDDDDSSTSSTSFSASSLLNSISSIQNDSIKGFMSVQSSGASS